MDGWEHLRKAQQVLSEAYAGEQDRLQVAARAFWSACYYDEHWPAELRRAADGLIRMLLAEGTIEQTVSRMNAVEVRRTSQAMWRFCELAWQLERRPPELVESLS